MANFHEWNFTDFLEATPYGDRKLIAEEEFYKEGFFIEPSS